MKPDSLRKFRYSLPRCHKHEGGFALVVTLTLMVLLSILALGMLSLASVELRSMSQSDSRSIARANALLALQLAIADLQESAGPDQRITAPGGVLGKSAEQQMITGVWKSRKLDHTSTASDFSDGEKEQRFVRWLVSGADPTVLEDQNYALTSLASDTSIIDLVSAANLEPGAAVVRATKVQVKSAKASAAPPAGSYAFAVLDEGMKARVNLGTAKPESNLASKSNALGSGGRPSLESISGIGSLPTALVDLDSPEGRSTAGKMVSLGNAEFAYSGGTGTMQRKLHDLTTTSSGVLADVANGGLKRDLNLLAETQNGGTLPSQYTNTGIYKLAFGLDVVSDPKWSRALGWANIFKSGSIAERTVGGSNVPAVTASAPTGWAAGTGRLSGSSGGNPATAQLSLVQPPGPVLLPSVAKIQMSFALAARDVYDYPKGQSEPTKYADGSSPGLHGPWNTKFHQDIRNGNKNFDSPYDYLLHMVYSPVITLHNPYNIPLTFTDLRVEFVNVPFAFQVFKNNIAQTKYPVPFSMMFGTAIHGGVSKRFGLTLTDTMLPGEVKVYSPDILPSRSWQAEVRTGDKVFWDWGNRNNEDNRAGGGTVTDTSRAKGVAGWNGSSVGYDLDFLCPGASQAYETEKVGTHEIDRWDGIPLKKDDEIHVLSAPIPDAKLPEKKFSVEMTLNYQTGKLTRSSALVFEYENTNDLQDILLKDNPQAANGTIRWPKGSDTYSTMQLFDHAQVPLRDIANTRPFALFSAYAKTTSGGKNTGGEEGLWVSKPYSFQNQTSVAISQNVRKGHPSHYSHELALSLFPELGIGIQASTNRGKFVSGHSDFRGRHFGTVYEVPLAPFQSLSALNSAQLASGNYLPHFSIPVGNSYAHPLLGTSGVIETGAAGYQYADHSFLLNAALYDSYYSSGFQTHGGSSAGGDGITADKLIEDFVSFGKSSAASPSSSPLPDKRLNAFFPDSSTEKLAVTALKADDGYLQAAAHQMMSGAFNVNSVSVDAWKAVLSSMSGDQAAALAIPGSTSGTTSLSEVSLQKMADPKGARFSRFRLPNSQPNRKDQDGFWSGSIDLDETQLTALAEEIVRQVRERGPFLSMSEFVNRQLGSVGEKTLAGALQTAIDKSGINAGVSSASASGIEITTTETASLSLNTPEALLGDSAQGAPGYLMQSDILAVLGNAATVRSDTFRIRAYGEALDKDGNVTARAYCEAIVQRTPDYLDQKDPASTAPAALTSDANKEFGRRFRQISMSWLSPDEI